MLSFDDPHVQAVGEELGFSRKELKKAYDYFLPLLDDVPEKAKKMPGYEAAALNAFKDFCIKSSGILIKVSDRGKSTELSSRRQKLRDWLKNLFLKE